MRPDGLREMIRRGADSTLEFEREDASAGARAKIPAAFLNIEDRRNRTRLMVMSSDPSLLHGARPRVILLDEPPQMSGVLAGEAG